MKFRLRIWLAIATLFALAGCGGTLRISINETNPPVFSFSASQFAECCDHLTFLTVSEVAPTETIKAAQGRAIWQIWPISGTDNLASGLPLITYGKVPPGFVQKIPVSGPPANLEEGKEYEAAGPLIEVPHAYLRFRIQNGKAVLISIPD